MRHGQKRAGVKVAAERRRRGRHVAALLLALAVLPCLVPCARAQESPAASKKAQPTGSPKNAPPRPAASATPPSPLPAEPAPQPRPQIALPQASPTTPPTPEPSWITYLTQDYPVLGVLLLIFFMTAILLFLFVILPWITSIRDRGWLQRGPSNDRMKSKRAKTTVKLETGEDIYYPRGGAAAARAKQVARPSTGEIGKKDYSEFRFHVKPSLTDGPSQGGKQTDTERGESRTQSAPRAGAQAKGAAGKPDASEATAPAAVSQPAVWSGPSAEKALSLLRHELDQLREELSFGMIKMQRELQDKSDKAIREIAWEVVPELAELLIKQKLDEAQSAAPAPASEDEARLLWSLEKQVRELHDGLASELHLLRDELGRLEKRQVMLDKTQESMRVEAADASARAIDELRTEVARIREELGELKQGQSDGVGDSEVPDSFYARTLGTILGQNVEALRDGNFEQLSRQVCERLNEFFQSEVPHGDKLQALRMRAEALSAAVTEVVAQVAKLKPEASEEAAPHQRRAAELAAELAWLQSQLQTRRATVETTLRVPVSLHAGARQSFLDELGRGLRREVDKLSDPQSHFAGELKRLSTDTVIPLADICDKKVSPPGARPELEAALNHLLAQAELLPILPRPGDAFRPDEQELVRLVPGAPDKSMRVAQVFTRGFYYEQPEGQRLLRKAGVALYR